ncbi:MAG TPA: laccase domain-containing protein [Solirubrobacteraceae bacterium]|jgi:YfiH family protein|nr:laccase domain-containing protein [Solirubrobacteraceae bacterium]
MSTELHEQHELYELYELPGGGRALFTGQAHGNLSSVGGRHAEHGLQARERLREAIGVRGLVRGYQVHGTVVGRVLPDGERPGPPDVERPGAPDRLPDLGRLRRPDGRRPGLPDGGRADLPNAFEQEDGAQQPATEADGHAVAAPDLAAMVLTADCIPVVLGAQGAVAALHAGWRGLAGGVLEEGVRALREVGGEGETLALIGPCAGACCYEVGEEVHAAFDGAHRNGRLIDLRAIARERLLAAGVEQVRDVAACTICDERYFSHRREGARAGRQAGLAWIVR